MSGVHLASGVTESTKRGLRTLLQVLASGAALVLAVAIPPVADALNAVIAAVGGDWRITPGIVAAVGTLASVAAGIIAKLQNLLEGRDKITSVDDAAARLEELTVEYRLLETAYLDLREQIDNQIDK